MYIVGSLNFYICPKTCIFIHLLTFILNLLQCMANLTVPTANHDKYASGRGSVFQLMFSGNCVEEANTCSAWLLRI